ncbi:MAG: alpha/beta hydrolase [Bifidobacteriaceae bacterium]|nr:alpha/beta hydrolase [Bifidobacteriaceae bacterium]
MKAPELFLERRGAGRPLVLLHGIGVDHRLLLPLDAAFSQVGGWERWYVDLPGFGQSPLPDGVTSTQTMADAVLAWVERSFPGEELALLGNSYGGLLARFIANRIPSRVAGLALVCPVVGADRSARTLPPRRIAVADPALAATAPPEQWGPYAELAVVQSQTGWDGFRQHVLPAVMADNAEVTTLLESAYDLTAAPEMGAAPFTGPTTIICGRDDHVVGFQDQLGLLPHYRQATYSVVADAGHNIILDQPGAVLALIVNWAARLG